MVAVSLAANVIGSDAAADGGGTPGCIRDHLKMKGVVALVDMIIAVAERSRLAFGQYSATLLMPALLRSQRGTAASASEAAPRRTPGYALVRVLEAGERLFDRREAGQHAAISATRGAPLIEAASLTKHSPCVPAASCTVIPFRCARCTT
jgi:hypothetical protein